MNWSETNIAPLACRYSLALVSEPDCQRLTIVACRSRAFIRCALAEPSMPVPSPTYLLQNIYDELEGRRHGRAMLIHVFLLPVSTKIVKASCCLGLAGLPIHHMDLYRINAVEELSRLQLEDSWQRAVTLIEWAERLGNHLPVERLSVTLQPVEEVLSRHISNHDAALHCIPLANKCCSSGSCCTAAEMLAQSMATHVCSADLRVAVSGHCGGYQCRTGQRERSIRGQAVSPHIAAAFWTAMGAEPLGHHRGACQFT